MSRQYHTSKKIGNQAGVERKLSPEQRLFLKKYGFEPANDMAGRFLANALLGARGGPRRRSRRRESQVHVAVAET